MATIVQTPGTVTVNQMRQDHNANDAAINAEVEAATTAIAAHKASGSTDHDGRYALNTALTTHKTSSDHDDRYAKTTDLNTHKTSTDHDGRYYTEAEIDAACVKKTGGETIAGVKTFTDEPVIKKTNPAFTLQDGAGNNRARFLGRLYEPGGAERNEAVLQAYDSGTGQFVNVLAAGMDGVVRDVSNKPMATQEYVQERIRSAYFSLALNVYATAAAGTETNFPQDLIPPSGARLMSAAFLRHQDDDDAAYGSSATASFTFTASGYQYLRAVLCMGANYSGYVFPYVKLQAGKIVSGTMSWTEILTVPAAQEIPFQIGNVCYMHLELGFAL